MFDVPFKAFPPALLAGGSIYALAVVLYLQPLVEGRMAEKTLIPDCQVNVRSIEASQPAPHQDKRRELQNFVDIFNITGLGDLPMTKEIIGMAEQQMDLLDVEPPRLSDIEMDSVCSCAVDTAMADARWSLSLHVGSLLTYTNSEVTHLDRAALDVAATGQCGALPWSQE